jgi:DNA modification methylase
MEADMPNYDAHKVSAPLRSNSVRSPNRKERRGEAAMRRKADEARRKYPDTLDRKIEHVGIDTLKPYERRARTHNENQLSALMASVDAFGFVDPIIVDANYRVLAGHGRWEAAKRLGYAQVPVVRIEHLTEDEIRAYVIAANRLAELAGWDRSILAIEFQALAQIDLGFELDVTGFSVGEIDLILGEAEAVEAGADPADEVPELLAGKAVSRLGDLWLLGRHRLLCGTALEAASYAKLMAGRQARLVLTDPPYNVPIDGFVSGLGRNRHRELACGEMSEAEFIAFLAEALGHMKASLVDGGLAYWFIDFRHLWELQSAARATDLKVLTLCVWDKQVAAMGGLYRNQHELVLVFRNGSAPYSNNVELGKHGRNRTTIWGCRGLASFGRGRDEALAAHPTVKPWQLLAESIMDSTKRKEIVLDPFLGSGSTLIAAEKTGRVAYGMEIDPLYSDLSIARWQKLTGETAVHAATGLSYAETAEQRTTDVAEADAKEAGSAGLTPRLDDPAPAIEPRFPVVRVRHRERPATLAMEALHG